MLRLLRSLTTVGLVALTALAAAAWVQDAEERPDHETSLDYAQMEEVTVTVRDDDRYAFAATVRHRDEGWDHYADAWEVYGPHTGEVYDTRELLHPHDQEQPFTRSLRGVVLSEGVTEVAMRAKCNVHGFGGKEVIVDLNEPEGESYELREE